MSRLDQGLVSWHAWIHHRDSSRRVLAGTAPDGTPLFSTTTLAIDEIGPRYDENGNKAEETNVEQRPDGQTDTSRTLYHYDADDRLVRVIDMSDPARPRTIEYRYDARGNRTEEIDGDGRTRKFEYDLRGNRVKQIDPEGGATAFRYDDANRLILLRDPNGGEIAWTYDLHGNLLTEKRSDGAMWTHTYDENDNRTTTSDPNGTLTTILYDDVDRLVARQIARTAATRGPSSITYMLDDLGRTTSTETDEGVKTFASYDSLDRELTEELQIGNGPKRTITKRYDLGGNLTSLTYPSGMALTHSIDSVGRIASISEPGAATPLVTWSDVGARLFGTTLSNGISHIFTYDANRRLDRILAAHRAAEAPPLFDVQYDWTAGGTKESVRRADLGKRWTYERNRNGWIKTETVERDTGRNPLERRTEYEIDPALNYRAIREIVQTPQMAVKNDVTTAINARHQYTTFGESPLAYDRNGNLTQTPDAQLAYDSENRLTRATLANGTVIDHLYDAFGRKVRETATVVGTTTTREYLLSGDAVIEEYTDGALAMRYVRGRGIDEVVRADRGTQPDGSLDTPLFAHQDELGNVLALTGLGGNLFERYEYDGYGKFRIFTPASPDPVSNSPAGWRWLFQGREYDPLLGAYDFRARTLWPVFVSNVYQATSSFGGEHCGEPPLGPPKSCSVWKVRSHRYSRGDSLRMSTIGNASRNSLRRTSTSPQ